jgi:hypothetical protein
MRREGARLPLLGVPPEMGRVHRLWLVVAGVAARIAWHLEDPMLRRP